MPWYCEHKDDGIPDPEFTKSDHIPLTTHTGTFGVDPIPVSWSHPHPKTRGPIICTVGHSAQRNAIGAHQGSYCIYTGLAVAAGKWIVYKIAIAFALAIHLLHHMDLSNNFLKLSFDSFLKRKIGSWPHSWLEVDISSFQDRTLSVMVGS